MCWEGPEQIKVIIGEDRKSKCRETRFLTRIKEGIRNQKTTLFAGRKGKGRGV